MFVAELFPAPFGFLSPDFMMRSFRSDLLSVLMRLSWSDLLFVPI
jgi:hypothetical protein